MKWILVIFHNFVNNRELVSKLADSPPIRAAAKQFLYYLHKKNVDVEKLREIMNNIEQMNMKFGVKKLGEDPAKKKKDQ